MPSPHSINFPDDPDPLARYRREYEQQQEELARNRCREEREQQRAPNDFWAHVDDRIAQSQNVITEATGEVIASERRDLQAALKKRDDQINLLRRELRTLRTEVDVKLKLAGELAAAQVEIAALRQRAPSFEAELVGLRETVEKQQKMITRLLSQQSQLEFAQKQVEAAQQKDRREVTLTAVQLTAFGQQTRQVLEQLRDAGVDFENWAPMGLAS
jgi:predicted RNase H-like nuclease (RuvC/YqgF family)